MLTLATTDSVTVQLGGAHVTTAPTFVACWLDNNNALGRLPGTLNGVTPVTAVAAPAAGNRLVSDLFVCNRDTVAHTVTITHVVSGGASTVVWTEEIAAGETANLLAPTRRGPTGPAGEGDVDGPASATDGNLVAFDGVTGKLLKDSGVALDALSPGGGAARWTPFTGFEAAAACPGGLILTDEIPGVEVPAPSAFRADLALPLRWRCDGDSAGAYRYGILRARGGDVEHTPHQGTAQAGSYTAEPFAATVTLAADASEVDDYYNGMIITITGGAGAGNRGYISDYDGTTKIATIASQQATPAWIQWSAATDDSSVYAMSHAVVAGSPLDADDIVEMEYGDSDRVIVLNLPISGEYSGEEVDAWLYRTLMGGIVPWAAARARIVQVGAWNATPDTGTLPRVQVFGSSLLADNGGDGLIPNGPHDGQTRWNDHGSIDVAHAGINAVAPNQEIDCWLGVQGGNGDAADLTVVLVLVLE